MGSRSYRELIVWQKAMDLVTIVYELSTRFPREETYGLVSQIRRSAVSVPANIAEGRARRTPGEFLNFISQAQGSLAEVDTQLLLAVRLGFVGPEHVRDASDLIDECQRILTALRAKLTPIG
jgi:four helix bundle protein